MKIRHLLLLFFSLLFTNIFPQTVPVTLHYKPIIDEFTTLRLVGNFNGWNNNDPNMVMTDDDGDGEYEITREFPTGVEHMYKFVFDADWSFAWNDPDNPNIKTSDNDNSILNVTDPHITYLLPRDINTAGSMYVDTTIAGEPIRAIFAFTASNPISTLIVSIDGNALENPLQYYDETKKEFYYQPPVSLSEGEHTVEVTITSSTGTVSKSSTFRRTPGLTILKAPVDFYFDEYNTGASVIQNINAVSLVGDFNNWNELFDVMQDDNNDGLWEVTSFQEKGSYEYKFKLNGSLWINDPDEPNFSEVSDNNIFTVAIDSIPSIKLVSPTEGTIFSSIKSILDLKVLLRAGPTSTGIDESTINVEFNDNPVSFTYDAETNILSSEITLSQEGHHIVRISFTNNENESTVASFSYGFYSSESGSYYADALDDENYSYPSGVSEGSADIISVLIDEVPSHDSLNFNIEIEDITDRTRLGLIITNPVTQSISDPLDLDVMIEDWQNEGIFIPIGAPGNTHENLSKENKIWITNEIISDVYSINVNSSATEENIFNFDISLALLDSLLGSWTRERNIYVFSYLANDDLSGNSFEVTSAEGGIDGIEDPDIYDAAFFRSGFWQKRVLSNFIPTGERMGPRIVSLNGLHRGKYLFNAIDISDSLATYGPAITFLTPSVTYWYSDVVVKGTLSDTEISQIIFSLNGEETSKDITNGEFAIPVELNSGENIIYVKATDSKGFESTSKNLILTYKKDSEPTVEINGSVDGRSISLEANATSPDSLTFTFYWSDDDDLNPGNLIGASADQAISFNVPNVDGEYFINVRARDSEGRFAYARRLIFAKGDSVYLAGKNDHVSWIDDAIFYEIYPRSYSQSADFIGIQNKIPEMVDLGINAVWLMPIYTGPTVHGYEITDYFGFEEDFGDKEDFQNLVDAFHEAGIKVILDFVVNHTGIQHPFMQNVLEYGENSPWADFYLWDGEAGNSNYEYFFDWASLPNLNHNNKDVRDYFIKAALYWVQEFNIDGYRCDVAWGVEERNTQFWQEWRTALRNIKPEIFLEAEASSSQSIYYENRFDSANDWDLRNDILGVASGTLAIDVLDAELRKAYPDHARPFRFVENHDESRIASTYDTDRSKLMHSILMTANGIPLIYSGGEVGELTNRGVIDWNDPDKLRHYFKQLIKIRKQFVSNPKLERITTSLPSDVYAFSSLSNNHKIVNVINFRDGEKNVSLDLSSLEIGENASSYYLTNLLDSTHIEITAGTSNNIEIQLSGYESKIFYFGTEPTIVDVEKENSAIINDYRLNQNYPNPFNPSTKIQFQLPKSEYVTLRVFDVVGREVKTILNKKMEIGKYDVDFNASDLSSGIYFYRLKAGSFISTKKMIFIK